MASLFVARVGSVTPEFRITGQAFPGCGALNPRLAFSVVHHLIDAPLDRCATAPLDPDRPRQFVDVAALNLRNREISDCRVGVPFERGRPLMTKLLAPVRPVFANVGFRASLGGQSEL